MTTRTILCGGFCLVWAVLLTAPAVPAQTAGFQETVVPTGAQPASATPKSASSQPKKATPGKPGVQPAKADAKKSNPAEPFRRVTG